MQNLAMKILVVLATAVPPSFTPALDSGYDDHLSPVAQVAAENSPEEILGIAVSELLEIVKRYRAEQYLANAYPPAGGLAAAVESNVLPLFDLEAMTRLVLGRNWRLATHEQQEALTVEFGRLLVQTCVAALTSSRDPTVVFKALPWDSDASAGTVTVRSFVMQQGNKPWTIDYDMRKTPAGWKVVDIKMDGMRLVAIHRDAFAEMVRNNGIDGLVTSLAQWNQRGDPRTADARRHFPAALILMHISTQRGVIGGS